MSLESKNTELSKYYARLQTAVARGLDWQACRQAGSRIDVHLQSGDVSVYWLWLLLAVSAISVVIVIFAICDMPRQEFSLCERVYIHNTYMKNKVLFWNTMQISSKVSRTTCA